MLELAGYKRSNHSLINNWIKDQALENHHYGPKPNEITEEILAALRDKNQSNQIRHYIKSICSLKSEHSVAFCNNLLFNFLGFYILAKTDDKVRPTIEKWIYKFQTKVNSFSSRLERSFE